MGKIIAAMNTTIDGFCDHTAGIPDEEIHDHYTRLLNDSSVILYGRITFGLMGFWKPFLDNPSGEKSMDDFAKAIDRIPKIVFSETLQTLDWHSASLSALPLEQAVLKLKQETQGDILVGSPSLIVQLANLGLVDEFQLCVHPVIIGKGLPLFKDLDSRQVLKFVKAKTFFAGAVLHYYVPSV